MMQPFRVSCILEMPEQLEPYSPLLELQGANLIVQSIFQALLDDERIEAFEFFLPPADYQRQEKLSEIAAAILTKERKGKGVLRFYSIHDMPEVWSDPTPRILLCLDHEFLSRDRYLRDKFAQGPVAIACQTHGLGSMTVYTELSKIAGAEPVLFDSILALSHATAESITRTFNAYLAPGKPLPCRMDLMPNPVDTDQFQPANVDQKMAYRKLLGLPQSGTLSLFLGRLTPNSKADLLPLIRIFGAVAGKEDSLLVAGLENVTGYANRLREAAKEANLEGRFFLQTSVEPWTRPVLYAASDIFVFPSDNGQECFGNTCLEAGAMGLPSIVSQWDGLQDAVKTGETGFVVPTYTMPGLDRVEAFSPASGFMSNLLLLAQTTYIDSKCWQEAWSQLLNSSDLREKMGLAARERIVKTYSKTAFLDRWFTLCEELRDLAIQEPAHVRETRRLLADSIGLPAPFGVLYGRYGTRDFDFDGDCVRLSDFGAKVADGIEIMRFYDETLPLIRQTLLDGLLNQLRKSPCDWVPMGQLVRAVSVSTGGQEGDIRWHLGLMLKREVLEFRPKP